MRTWLSVALALSATLGIHGEVRAAASRAERAAELFASAERRLARGTHEQRQFALTELRDAVHLDPTRTDIALVLGRLYLEADLLGNARDVVEHLVARDTADAEAWLFAGRVWKRYWLATIDATARDRAIICLARSARLAPREPRAWTLLAPLLVDADELQAAHHVATYAARAAPADPEAQVQLAAAAQRLGDLATAERLFDMGVPRLPAGLRERYEDLAPLLPPSQAEPYAALDPPARERFNRRFWSDNDPDPVSVENEARLEYWARVTQAVSLYGTSDRGEWDMRAQYYVRFGQPAIEEVNPITKPEQLRRGDWLAWTYPELGMRVWMGTPSMFFGFTSPVSSRALQARAWPESLARHGELLPLQVGWAVLHRLPPGVTPLETRLALAQFPSGPEVGVLAQAEAAGEPGDDLSVEWVVFDSTRAEVARERHSMTTSACGADRARAGGFTARLSPGRYCVGVEVSDGAGRRGVVRRDLVVSAASDRLALSDLVVTCSPPEQSVVAGAGIRLEPETGLFPVEGDELNAYFEIYHLTPSEDGEAHFEYECFVRSLARDSRGWLSRLLQPRETPPEIAVSRVETTLGPLRRQFLSVPVGSLPAGTYRLAVRVRDVASDETADAAATFQRRR